MATSFVVMPDKVKQWNRLYRQATEGKPIENEDAYQEYLDTLEVPVESDSKRLKIDYDKLKSWRRKFQGKILKDSRRKREPFISLVMILKNEANTLRRAIKSCYDVVDEIIIGVDETSRDKTEELALELGDVVFRYEWLSDFAWARNNAMKLARGQWIFTLDGHEELDYASVPMVRIYTEGLEGRDTEGRPKDYSVVVGNTVMNPQSETKHGMMFPQPRLFRRIPKHFYKYDTHHQLSGTKDASVYSPNVRIFHMMPHDREVERAKQRGGMNSRNLLRAVVRDIKDERAIFYLANTYCDDGQMEAAHRWYNYHISMSSKASFKYHSWQQLASVELSLADPEDEEVLDRVADCLHNARKVSWYRAETAMALGNLAEVRGEDLEAEHWFKQAVELPMAPGGNLYVQKQCYTWLPWKHLSALYERLKQWDQCLAACERWLEYEPQDAEALARWRMSESRCRERRKDDGVRIVIFDSAGVTASSLVEGLIEEGQQVEVYEHFDTRFIRGADVLWFEHADGNLIKATHHDLSPTVICRVHRHEPYMGLLQGINFEKVRSVVFTSEHIRRASFRLGQFPENTDSHIVPPGLRLDRWTYEDRRGDRKNVAFIGHLGWRKDVPSLLEIWDKVVDEDKDYKLFIFGSWQTPEVEEYAMHYAEKWNLQKNIVWKGWQNDLNRALDANEIGQVVNCSISEGCPYSLLEAMAKGIRPVIRAWPGADGIFDEKLLFETVEQGADLILNGSIDSGEYRVFVEENHNSKLELEAILSVIESTKEVTANAGAEDIKVPG